VSVYDLTCGACGGELLGLEFDVLFCCPQCQTLRDPVHDRSHTITRLHSDGGDRGQRVLLPFWSFGYQLTCRDGKGRASRAAQRVVEQVRRVFVPAFAIAREDVYGDPGLVWTQRQDEHTEAPLTAGDTLAVVGVRRGEESARGHVLPYLLTMIDGLEDITGLDADATVSDPKILAVPWADLGHELYDPWSGLKFPAAVLDDIAGMRATVSAG